MSAHRPALLTDFYQLTMAHAYFELSMNQTAVFEMFVRRLPPERRFLLAAGLAQAVECLRELRFSPAELDFLAREGSFSRAFLEYLEQLRFTGSLEAMPEGTVFFAEEPLLRVTAPMIEAQLLESRLLNIVHFQTLIASKAARCVLSAGGKRLADFGMRRAHEADAALYAARASYLAGFDATATVEASRRFEIPLAGTMAHSFVEAHDREEDAFDSFVRSRRTGTTLLIDTYDVEKAARKVVTLARNLKLRNPPLGIDAVRIDSGDFARQAYAVRQILDAGGCPEIQIVLSGGLDEYGIRELAHAGVPVDTFGVGTSLAVSADDPSLDMVYKLQMYADKPRRKWSPGKQTWPGVKQVFRTRNAGGIQDQIALVNEPCAGTPLLASIMGQGKLIEALPDLSAIRAYARAELDALPAALKALDGELSGVTVSVSEGLRALAKSTDSAVR